MAHSMIVRMDKSINAEKMDEVEKLIIASDDFCALYVDIDGTLITEDGEPNEYVVTLMKKLYDKGVKIFLWSVGGVENCKMAARRYDIDFMIQAYLPGNTHMQIQRKHDLSTDRVPIEYSAVSTEPPFSNDNGDPSRPLCRSLFV